MQIIGVDLHTRQQTVPMLNVETHKEESLRVSSYLLAAQRICRQGMVGSDGTTPPSLLTPIKATTFGIDLQQDT